MDDYVNLSEAIDALSKVGDKIDHMANAVFWMIGASMAMWIFLALHLSILWWVAVVVWAFSFVVFVRRSITVFVHQHQYEVQYGKKISKSLKEAK